MDFTPTEAQQELAGLTRGIVSDLVTNDRLRELDAAEDRFDRRLWSALARPACSRAALPESVGGDGFGVLEQCSVLRRTGPRRRAGAVPVVDRDGRRRPSRSSVTTQQRSEWGSPAQRAGENDPHRRPRRGTQRHPGAARHGAPNAADGWTLDGTKITVDRGRLRGPVPGPGNHPGRVSPSSSSAVDDAGVTVTRQQTVDLASTGRGRVSARVH